jgi:hypothetical protein
MAYFEAFEALIIIDSSFSAKNQGSVHAWFKKPASWEMIIAVMRSP